MPLYWLLRGVEYLARLIRSVLLLLVLFFLIAGGLALFKDIEKYKAFHSVIVKRDAMEKPALAFVRKNFPTNFKGIDIGRWMLIIGVYLVSLAFGIGAEKIEDRALFVKRKFDKARAPAAQPGTGPAVVRPPPRPAGGGTAQLQSKLKSLQSAGGEMDREKLLEIYAEAKKKLEAQKRHLAFLCIDVADSTGMKQGEIAEIAERDFRQYHKHVEAIFAKHSPLKSTWTPDGVMICFPTTEDAIEAAMAVVNALGEFNRKVKAIKRDFKLRVGINAGEVSYDEAMAMEEMTDRVIDIADHMQKHGEIDAVTISKHAIEPLLAKYPFKPADREVDGLPVYAWQPESNPAQKAA